MPANHAKRREYSIAVLDFQQSLRFVSCLVRVVLWLTLKTGTTKKHEKDTNEEIDKRRFDSFSMPIPN